jgi:5'-nucleotidase
MTKRILVTNDDGVTAPGLLALAQALRSLGEVTVLAPDRNWSASGHVKTLDRPLRIRSTTLADGSAAYASDGAPSDCVALALLGFLPDPVDLVVSGINPNANLGHDATYSGTVTAAMEAAIGGLPGIAVSLDRPEGFGGAIDYAPAAAAAVQVARPVLQAGLPQDIFLNVNVPFLKNVRGLRVTRQGLRVYRDLLVVREDPRGQPYYWIGGEAPTGKPEEGDDFSALQDGYVSITPMHLDLTAHRFLAELHTWDFGGEAGGAG